MSLLAYHFTSTGQPVIVLSHGFLGNKEQWDIIAAQLRGYDVLRIELPGHGSSPSCSDYTLEELACELSGFLLANYITQIHYIGHSMGGYLGCVFAANYPEQVKRLTLINSIAGPDTVARKQIRNRAIQLIDRFKETYVSMAISNLFTHHEQQEYAAQITQMKQQASEINLESVLAALRVMRDRKSNIPFLKESRFSIDYIYGSEDTVIEVDTINNELKQLPAVGTTIPGGHMLLLTHADKVLHGLQLDD